MDKLAEIKNVIGDIENTVETHMSIIYMGSKGLVAKEIKKVDLGFVNLISLEKREETAVKTAQIDTTYCPDLGSKVVHITDEPMIIMRRFDSSQELDNLYEQGNVTTEHACQIGALFAEAHKKATTNAHISEIGFKAISDNWEECFVVSRDVAQAIGKTVSTGSYQKIVEKIRKFILDNKLYLISRRDNSFIRQCHGDGHAGNMFVEDGQVKIFDGIGFKDEFSFSDTIADIAFPIMDAVAKGKEDIAEEIKTSYKEKSQDFEGIDRLLNFYTCYRAFVRGQVSTMIADGMEGETKTEMLETASKYYNLAVKYLPS